MSEDEKELLRLLYINNLSQYGKRKLEAYIKQQQEIIKKQSYTNKKMRNKIKTD